MATYISFSAQVTQESAQQLVALCAQEVNGGVTEIVLALSTPGGHVDAGIMVYNTLRGLPIHLTTFNVGAVSSIGNAVFLAGETRYAAPSSTFLFHGVAVEVPATKLEEKRMTELLEIIQISQQKIGHIISSRTSIDAKEAKRLFFKQETKDTDFALEKGIIHEVRNFSVPAGSKFLQLVFKY